MHTYFLWECVEIWHVFISLGHAATVANKKIPSGLLRCHFQQMRWWIPLEGISTVLHSRARRELESTATSTISLRDLVRPCGGEDMHAELGIQTSFSHPQTLQPFGSVRVWCTSCWGRSVAWLMEEIRGWGIHHLDNLIYTANWNVIWLL